MDPETGYPLYDRETPEHIDAEILVGWRKTDSAMQGRRAVSSAMAMSHLPDCFFSSVFFFAHRVVF